MKGTRFTRENVWLEYIIVAVFLVMSGNPAIMRGAREEIWIALVAIFLLAVLAVRNGVRKEAFLTSRFIVVLSVLCSILAVQCVTFGFWPFHTMIGFLLRLATGYAVVTLVRDFPKKYVTALFYTCLISFPFHLLAILHVTTGFDLIKYFAPLANLAQPYRGFHIFIHNYIYYANVPEFSVPDPFRNSSFFWEPGAFAAYILLAIIFLGLVKDRFDTKRYKQILAILVIALLTTMSTTGYLVLPVCLLVHLRKMHPAQAAVAKKLGIVMGFALCGYLAWYLGFIGPKLEEHYYTVKYREPGWQESRLGAIVHDIEYMRQRPFLGWGLHEKTRYMLDGGESVYAMGNGLTDFTVKFGFLGLITALIAVGFSLSYLTNNNRLLTAIGLLFFVLVLNGEHLLEYPTYLGLMFIGPKFKNWQTAKSL